ncbi:HDOD domain-containing protein, partial [Staphylococcus aureus]|nr:HDOD domain-containing protein [Staphylococcus aureus]
AAVVKIVSADPELSIRVLHLINSSAYGLRRQIDSVHQAVVLVGPNQLAALATASLVDARPTTVGPLCSMLSRARTMHALSGSDAGYTVGLLSA